MKRDIKFRVWDDTKKCWVSKFMIDPNGRIEVFLINDPNNVISQQFTGCLDKNGEEIYEGDILHYYYDDSYKTKNINLLCVYDESNAWFGFTHEKEDWTSGYYWMEIKNHCTVIGNICETPHLV